MKNLKFKLDVLLAQKIEYLEKTQNSSKNLQLNFRIGQYKFVLIIIDFSFMIEIKLYVDNDLLVKVDSWSNTDNDYKKLVEFAAVLNDKIPKVISENEVRFNDLILKLLTPNQDG